MEPRERFGEQVQDATDAAAKEFGGDLLLFNAPVERRTQESLEAELACRPAAEKLNLILVSEGGDPNAAYKIARTLQQTYEHYTCYVPAYSKSAATILVIGASELVLSDSGELGPIDVQLRKQDTLAEHESGLTVLTALGVLHEKAFDAWEHFFLAMEQRSGGGIALKTAAHIAAELTTGLFGPVYGQINPFQLGQAARAMLIGNEYGKRLNSQAKNLRPGALDQLVSGYPDHGFVIDRIEANRLFYRVRRATDSEFKLSKSLGPLCDVARGTGSPSIGFLNAKHVQSPAVGEHQ